MAVTQKQIAAHLGISPQAVGFGLRGDGTISENLRQRVRDAASELGYAAGSNQAARIMAAQRHGTRPTSGLIGCVWRARAGHHPYWMHLQSGMRTAAQRAGQDLILLDPEFPGGWERVDGGVGHGAPPELLVKVPYVALMENASGFSSITVDNEDGMRQATEHLLSLGHRKIGYLANENSSPAKIRLASYRAALKAAGIEPEPQWQRLLFDWGHMEDSGRLVMAEWLKEGFLDLGLTALLVQNDRAAMGAMQSLWEAGIRIPQDISIVGFDGTDECEIVYPRLTSVKIPLEAMGERAVELLQRHIQDKDFRPENSVFPVELQVRASTAPPRKS